MPHFARTRLRTSAARAVKALAAKVKTSRLHTVTVDVDLTGHEAPDGRPGTFLFDVPSDVPGGVEYLAVKGVVVNFEAPALEAA